MPTDKSVGYSLSPFGLEMTNSIENSEEPFLPPRSGEMMVAVDFSPRKGKLQPRSVA
jgi:hypothetical protein